MTYIISREVFSTHFAIENSFLSIIFLEVAFQSFVSLYVSHLLKFDIIKVVLKAF